MEFQTLAAVRWGFGPGPRAAAPETPAQMLAALRAGDGLAQRWPGMTTDAALEMSRRFHELKKAEAAEEPGAALAFKQHKDALHGASVAGLQLALARAVEDGAGLRERLWAFWRDHFTVQGKRRQDMALAVAHGEAAVRPHLTGTFRDMLRAAVLHPMMLIYLDQTTSVGPSSPEAQRRARKMVLGLNENLAREVMELHTLGVGGSYAQGDVRELAELLTGLVVQGRKGTQFRPELAEPGAETVLGVAYGGDPARLEHVGQVLDALALHPDTGRHLARKLAVHFIGPEPPEALVGAMAEAYGGAQGALMAVYQVMLEHPAAQGALGAKVRQPFEYIASAMRALGLDGAAVMALPEAGVKRFFYWPMVAMGQRWLAPPGPDGWPEAAEEWIAPPLLSARIEWALRAPGALAGGLPEPRAFMRAALGARLSPAVEFAVPRAESAAEAVALVLASAEFNRR